MSETLESLTVVLGDRSGSMTNYGNFDNLKSTILDRMNKGVEDSKAGRLGRLILISFDHECDVVMDKSYSEIDDSDRKALDEWFKPRGTTAFYDGVIKSIEWVQRYDAVNKIVVLVTDGLENASVIPNAQKRAQSAIEYAKKSNVSVFLVGDQDCLKEQQSELKMVDPKMVLPLSRQGSTTLQRVVTSCAHGKPAFFTLKDQMKAMRRIRSWPAAKKPRSTILLK
jgi:hypothetical protein